MKKFIITVLYLSTVLFASVPEWYLSLPTDTKKMYYAVGEGDDISAATKEALSYIASQVNVTIKSSFKKSTNSNRSNGGEHISSNTQAVLKSYTKPIDFNNFQVLKNEVQDGRAYVLISVDKIKWIEEKNKLLKVLNIRLSDLDNNFDSQVMSMKLRDSFEMKIKIREAKKLIQIITAINSSYFKKKKQVNYILYEVKIEKIINNVIVFIDTKDSDFDSIKEAIHNYLSKQRVKLAFTKIDSDQLVTIKIGGNINYKKSYGNFIIDGKISYTIKDGDIVTNLAIKKIQAKSVVDYQSAQLQLQKKMNMILSEEGFFNYIGL